MRRLANFCHGSPGILFSNEPLPCTTSSWLKTRTKCSWNASSLQLVAFLYPCVVTPFEAIEIENQGSRLNSMLAEETEGIAFQHNIAEAIAHLVFSFASGLRQRATQTWSIWCNPSTPNGSSCSACRSRWISCGGTVVLILIPLAELKLCGIQAANLQGSPVSAPSRNSRWAHFA